MSLDYKILGFGKYKTLTPTQVGNIDPSYIVWMYENVTPPRCSQELYEACRLDTQEDEGGEGGYELFPGDPLTGRLSDD